MLFEIPMFIILTVLSVYIIYLYYFALVSFIFRHTNFEKKRKSISTFNKFALIIPAHNEELLIGECLDSAFKIEYPKTKYDVIVIADNCDDSTADIARGAGAICYERIDDSLRGKPFALNWIFTQIPLNVYDAYVIIDADTVIDKKFLWAMNTEINAGYKVIQGYFGISNPDESWITRLMVIPGILKYRYRYVGKKAMGLSCPLMGNGMCFSREVIERYGWDALTLTENWEYYVKLLLRGYYSTYCDEAYIYSQTAKTLKQGKVQRKRWLKGRLQVISQYFPALVAEFLKKGNVKAIDCCVELTLPSISMLFNYAAILFFSTVMINFAHELDTVYSCWAIFLMFVMFAYFCLGIASSKSPLKTLRALLKAPIFLGWKLVISITSLCSLTENRWVKTDRHLSS